MKLGITDYSMTIILVSYCILNLIYNYLHQGGYVLSRVCLLVSLFVCLSVF